MRFGSECEEPSDNDANGPIMSETREIKLPADLCAAAEEKFATIFRTVDELVSFVLQELIRGDTVDLDRGDQAIVEQRLKDLGYI